MNKILLAGFALVVAPSLFGAPVVLNISTSNGAGIGFFGGFLGFTSVSGTNLQIDSSTGGVGDAVGTLGQIAGLWQVGPITTIGQFQSASVTSVVPSGINLDDFKFNADLEWVDIFTFGAAGGLNAGATVNLTNITYTGTKADLLEIAAAPSGVFTATFQFAPIQTLSQLVASPELQVTSFSGTISATAVPEPLYSGLALAGGLLAAFGLARRRMIAG